MGLRNHAQPPRLKTSQAGVSLCLHFPQFGDSRQSLAKTFIIPNSVSVEVLILSRRLVPMQI